MKNTTRRFSQLFLSAFPDAIRSTLDVPYGVN